MNFFLLPYLLSLLLNFTAMGFVSELDEVVFFLAMQGFVGVQCEEAAEIVTGTSYYVPKKKLRATKMVLLSCLFSAMVAGWSVVVQNQVNGKYLCSTIFVQIGDDLLPALGTFSGLYDLQSPTDNGFGSQYMSYVDRRSGKATFGYCEDSGAWTLQWNESNETTSDPCNWVAMSSPTTSYDITTTASDKWYAMQSSRTVVLDPFLLECYDCGSDDAGCNGRGVCSNAICDCIDGVYGLRCEFSEPCQSLVLDARTEGFIGTRHFSTTYERLELDNDTNRQMPTFVQFMSRRTKRTSLT